MARSPIFLMVQREVEHRGQVGRVGRERTLEQQLRRRIAPELGLYHRHVREDFLRMIDLQVERRLVFLERLVEAPAPAQEAGEVEARHGVPGVLPDQPR